MATAFRQALSCISGNLVTPCGADGGIAPGRLRPTVDRALAANAPTAGLRPFDDIRAEDRGGADVTGGTAALVAQGLDRGLPRRPSAWPLTPPQVERLTRSRRTTP